MRKISNFCGIFATLFVTTTIILLASCSQDDDYYDNSEMYTLAEEMGTRSGGGDPGSGSVEIKKLNLMCNIGENQLHFFQQGTINQTTLNLHLYALADSAFTQWGAYAVSNNNNVEVTSATAEYMDSDSININLRIDVEILYQKKCWTNSNTYSCPRDSFIGSIGH